MEEACRQLGFECTADPSARLGWGGPVANTRGFIVHAPAADGEPLIFTDGELALGASANLLKAIAEVEERYEAALAAVGDEPPEPTDIPSVSRMPGPGHA